MFASATPIGLAKNCAKYRQHAMLTVLWSLLALLTLLQLELLCCIVSFRCLVHI